MANDGWQVFGSIRKEADAAAQDALGEAFTLLAFDSWDTVRLVLGTK